MRYQLRTLMILLAIGPPMLALVWLYTIPITTSLPFFVLGLILAACIHGAVLGRTMLWGIEALFALAGMLLCTVRHIALAKGIKAEINNLPTLVALTASRFLSGTRCGSPNRIGQDFEADRQLNDLPLALAMGWEWSIADECANDANRGEGKGATALVVSLPGV